MPLITHAALRNIPDSAKEFFIFATDLIALPATLNDVQTTNIRFTQESHFVAIKLVFEETSNDTDFSVQLEPSEGDRRLQSTFIRVNNYFGTAQLPMIMPQPRLFLANTVLNIRLRNDEAVAKVVQLCFIGFKIFYDLNQLDLTARRS